MWIVNSKQLDSMIIIYLRVMVFASCCIFTGSTYRSYCGTCAIGSLAYNQCIGVCSSSSVWPSSTASLAVDTTTYRAAITDVYQLSTPSSRVPINDDDAYI